MSVVEITTCVWASGWYSVSFPWLSSGVTGSTFETLLIEHRARSENYRRPTPCSCVEALSLVGFRTRGESLYTSVLARTTKTYHSQYNLSALGVGFGEDPVPTPQGIGVER